MRFDTYEKARKVFCAGNGYAESAKLRSAGLTSAQLRCLVEAGLAERISHGYYWMAQENSGKPDQYEMIEACMVNPRAVICADSACYYHGLIDDKPERLSVATRKTDRARMQLNFPVTRHYYSERTFDQEIEVKETPYGDVRVYGIDRSVCDAIRFRKDIGMDVVNRIIQNYMKDKNRPLAYLYAYADAMRVGAVVRMHLDRERSRRENGQGI